MASNNQVANPLVAVNNLLNSFGKAAADMARVALDLPLAPLTGKALGAPVPTAAPSPAAPVAPAAPPAAAAPTRTVATVQPQPREEQIAQPVEESARTYVSGEPRPRARSVRLEIPQRPGMM